MVVKKIVKITISSVICMGVLSIVLSAPPLVEKSLNSGNRVLAKIQTDIGSVIYKSGQYKFLADKARDDIKNIEEPVTKNEFEYMGLKKAEEGEDIKSIEYLAKAEKLGSSIAKEYINKKVVEIKDSEELKIK